MSRQPEALHALLAAYAADDGPLSGLSRAGLGAGQETVFMGMGSSLFAARPAVCALAAAGLRASAIDASEYLHYLWRDPARGTLPVLVSQSGKSAEILKLAEKLSGRARFIAITNDAKSPLARQAAHVLPLMAGEEAATTNKTYTNSVAACLLLAARLAGEDLRGLLERMTRAAEFMAEAISGKCPAIDAVADFIGDCVHLDLVGRGPSLATARQGALILRELAHLKCSAVNAGLFRHGMIPSMRDGSPLIAFAPASRAGKLTAALAHEVGRAGGRALIVTDGEMEKSPGCLPFPIAGAGEYLAPLLEIIPVEFLGLILAKRRGIEPGEGLVKVTTSE